MHFDPSFVYVILQVIFLEGILSIDNAAVLGAMVSVLPRDTAIPWPRPLAGFGMLTHRILGGQRTAALKVGLLGAYVGRGLMLVLASFVIRNHVLKILGAAYLIKLAFENLGERQTEPKGGTAGRSVDGRGFWGIVLAVELADLAFSLDNVVAVIAISDNLYIVLFGVFVGILTMRFAAGAFTFMISKEPILKPATYVVVFNIAVELLLAEFWQVEIGGALKFLVSLGTLILAVIYARVKPLHVLAPVFRWIGEGIAMMNDLVEWALAPVAFSITALFRGLRILGRRAVVHAKKPPAASPLRRHKEKKGGRLPGSN